MEIDDRFKKFIFKKLAKDLSNVEVIPYEGSIWFIDRDKKYWYLELKKNGHLWWRLDFFNQFFQSFPLERDDYQPIIIEWVEYLLNRKVDTNGDVAPGSRGGVEQVLNRKVKTSLEWEGFDKTMEVGRILNSK